MSGKNTEYAVELGFPQPNGLSDVALKVMDKTLFTTTHRGVLTAFLAYFYTPGCAPARSVNTRFASSPLGDDDGCKFEELLRLGMQPPVMRPVESFLQQYLCVFHQEELKNQHNHHVVGHSHTLCTAYKVQDVSMTKLVLHNIQLSSARAGVGGVFVHGRRETERGEQYSPLQLEGKVYCPASDLWWMASPMVTKPVYLCEESNHFCEKTGGDPKGVKNYPDGKSGIVRRHQAPNSAIEAGIPHSRVDVCVPSPRFKALPKSANSGSSNIGNRSVTPTGNHGASSQDGTALSWCVGAQVLLQYHGFGMNDERTVVVTCAPSKVLRLATTKPRYDLDILTWDWSSHHVCIPTLSMDYSVMDVVVTEHDAMNAHVLFVSDASLMKIHVVRAPSFQTSTNDKVGPIRGMRFLFTISNAHHPTVLPCLRDSSPQPVMVCNYPQENFVTLYDPISLLQLPTEKNYIVAFPLEMTTVFHDEDGVRSVSSNNSVSSSLDASPVHSAAIARVDFINYCSGTTVSFSHQVSAMAPSCRRVGPDRDQTILCRRRSEVSVEQVIVFPSLCDEKQPLMQYVLESLEATVGLTYAHPLACELLRRLWESKRHKKPWDGSRACCELIFEIFLVSLCSNSEVTAARKAVLHNSRRGNTQTQPPYTLCLDPYSLTASAVESFCSALHHSRTPQPKQPLATPWNTLGRPQTSPPKRFIWPPEICGVIAFTLHVLYESCRLQERLWPLLEHLSALLALLTRLLKWEDYANYYNILADDFTILNLFPNGAAAVLSEQPSPSHPEWSFRNLISEQLISECHFVKINTNHHNEESLEEPVAPDRILKQACKPESFFSPFAPGSVQSFERPPSLYRKLQRLMQRSLAFASEEDLQWPVLCSPLLTDAHPIAMANRLYALYRDCFQEGEGGAWWQSLCHGLVRHRLSAEVVSRDLALGVAYPVLLAVMRAKETPPSGWTDALYAAVGRLDRMQGVSLRAPCGDVVRLAEERAVGTQQPIALVADEGVMMRPDFFKMWSDTRLDVASALLNTAGPIPLRGQVHTVDELGRLAKRACTLPIGRGMLTMCTQNFKVRDSIPIPPLNLHGCTNDGIMVSNTLAEYQPDSLVWPVFYNACAAGFRFLPLKGPSGDGSAALADLPSSRGAPHVGPHPFDSTDQRPFVDGETPSISRHWVVYQTRSTPCPSSRAGLLLAAGVLGHLTVLEKTDIFSLLTFPQVHSEAMTISVILGLSSSFRGTGNDVVFSCLLMHVQSLTPRVEEIEVPLDVQTSALVSIGLLCQQMPTNTFLIEMFLTEMSRLPSDEHCVNREGYALAAGLGLGLQLLGMGGQSGVPSIEDRLFKFMNGARREPPASVRRGLYEFNEVNRDTSSHFLTRALLMQTVKDSCRSSCMKVYEGNYYNVAVSAPAAVMALGLLYLKSDRESVADQLRPPNQIAGIQAVSPFLCMLRTMMGNLIMWSDLFSSRDALYSTVPRCLLGLTPESGLAYGLASQQVHYLMMNLGYCVAGATMALGLRYAGSMDADTHAIILAELQGFLKGHVGSTGVPVPTFQRSTGVYEPCIAACCVALGFVMSGSGDLRTFTILQRLQRRNKNSYGLCMAIAMSIGLLFLGGGHLTLATDTASVAALLLAFYPVWPHHPEDNTHHLLALRALYGLAVVPRVVQTVDALTKRPVSVPIRVILRKGRVCQDSKSAVSKHLSWTPLPYELEKQEVRLQTPCLYPPPEMIESIEIRSTQHYPQVLTHETHAITEYGLCVCILERRPESGEAVTSRKTGQSSAISHARNINEQRLLDAVRGLFCQQQRASMSVTLSTIDSIKLLLTAQQMLLRSVGLCEDYHEFISRDFGCAVEQTMQRRYQFIFSHGPQRTRVGSIFSDEEKGCADDSQSAPHPLRALLIQQKSFTYVIQAILRDAKGTRAFPCDFTALSNATEGITELHTDSASAATHQKSHTRELGHLEVTQVKRWIAEALHFYLDIGGGIQELRLALSDRDALTRRQAFGGIHLVLQLKQRLMLPMATLEKLLVCCL